MDHHGVAGEAGQVKTLGRIPEPAGPHGTPGVLGARVNRLDRYYTRDIPNWPGDIANIRRTGSLVSELRLFLVHHALVAFRHVALRP